jgi:hypothetical protein
MRTRHDTGQDLAALTRLLQDLAADMPAAHRQRLRDHLVTETRRAEPTRSPVPGWWRSTSPRGRLPRRAWLIVASGAAVAGVAAGVIAIGVTSSGGPTLPPASKGAVRLLAKVADAAARQPVPHVRDSQYMYLETVVAYPSPPLPMKAGSPLPRRIHLKKVTSQSWSPVADVCRTGLERTIPPKGPATSARFDAGGAFKCPSIGSLNAPSYRLLQTLPTNPHALLAMIYRMERGHGPSPDQEAFVTIGDLLRNTIAPPKVTAALYRAAALIPRVTLVPHATDAIGRPGVAVAQIGPGVDGGVRDELIFSTTSLQLIGERTTIARTGVTTSATAIIARAFADHLGQLPPSTRSAAS